MQSFGPYFVQLYQFNQRVVNINSGKASYLEILNYGPAMLQVNFQSGGTLWHGGRKQAIYKLVDQNQGAQTITITIPMLFSYVDAFIAPNVPLQILNFTEPSHLSPANAPFFVNIYQDGEIDWYPPFELSSLINKVTNFTTHAPAAGPYTLLVPTTATAFTLTRVPAAFQNTYLTGFDITIDAASASTTGTMTITNLQTQDDGSNQLAYRLRSMTVPDAQLYSIRFPDPISNQSNSQITFNMPSLGDAQIALNVFYFL